MYTNEKDKIKYYYEELCSDWDEVAKLMNADCSVHAYTAESCQKIYLQSKEEN